MTEAKAKMYLCSLALGGALVIGGCNGGSGGPTVPKNAGQIVFASNGDGDNEIYIVNADGTAVNQLTQNTANDDQPALSPDRQKIAFVRTFGDANESEIYVMNADGSSQRRLTFDLTTPGARASVSKPPSGNLSVMARINDYPTWSPDGKKVAFVSTRSAQADIYVLDIEAADVQDSRRRLTNDGVIESSVHFRPDGNGLIYSGLEVIDSIRTRQSLFYIGATGRGLRRLTEGARDVFPAYSPDGRRIVFASGRDNNYEIYSMNADGTGQTRITNHAADDRKPVFSPDGQSIAFLSDRNAPAFEHQIHLMEANGSETRRLTTAPGYVHSLDWR